MAVGENHTARRPKSPAMRSARTQRAHDSEAEGRGVRLEVVEGATDDPEARCPDALRRAVVFRERPPACAYGIPNAVVDAERARRFAHYRGHLRGLNGPHRRGHPRTWPTLALTLARLTRCHGVPPQRSLRPVLIPQMQYVQ